MSPVSSYKCGHWKLENVVCFWCLGPSVSAGGFGGRLCGLQAVPLDAVCAERSRTLSRPQSGGRASALEKRPPGLGVLSGAGIPSPVPLETPIRRAVSRERVESTQATSRASGPQGCRERRKVAQGVAPGSWRLPTWCPGRGGGPWGTRLGERQGRRFQGERWEGRALSTGQV